MYDRDTLKDIISQSAHQSRTKGMASYYMSNVESPNAPGFYPVTRMQNNSTMANVSRQNSIEAKQNFTTQTSAHRSGSMMAEASIQKKHNQRVANRNDDSTTANVQLSTDFVVDMELNSGVDESPIRKQKNAMAANGGKQPLKEDVDDSIYKSHDVS